MNSRLAQALTRAFWVFVAAGAAAIGLNAVDLVKIGTDDPILSPVILAAITGIIQFVMKYAGGPTVAADGEAGPDGVRTLTGRARGTNTLAV